MKPSQTESIPVDDREVVVPDGQFLVSKTDTRGVITYANRIFIEIAGYAESELLGRPHNIVRHPDMPKAAFRELWDTVRAGREWHGLVKNRCKDGRHYWVDATVTPSWLGGEIVGYMSVRRRPASRQAIAEAAESYRALRSAEGAA